MNDYLLVIIYYLGGALLVAGFIRYASHKLYLKAEEEKRAAWQPLLKINPQLKYVKTSFFSEEVSHVTGNFGNHHVKLDTIYRRKEDKPTHIYTRLTLPITENKNSSIKSMTTSDVAILFAKPEKLNHKLRGRIHVQTDERKLEYEQYGLEGDVDYLQFLLGYLGELAEAYPTLIISGGIITLYLQEIAMDKNHQLQYLAFDLLQDIAQDTTERLSDRLSDLVCPFCYTRFTAHQLSLLWQKSITFYGCRICYQSREFFEGPLQIIAVLDDKVDVEVQHENNTLYVNWLSCRESFDFDKVKIIRATDEDVERFAVQASNDTNELRQSWYKKMECTIASSCELSINTTRILERMFGKVVKSS